jgi:quinol monooxygenase YgiN
MGMWTAVDWRVQQGRGDEFSARWRDMMTWAEEHAGTLEWARLIRDADDPDHFISMGAWRDPGMQAAIAQEEFRALIEQCEALCTESAGGPGTEAVRIGQG